MNFLKIKTICDIEVKIYLFSILCLFFGLSEGVKFKVEDINAVKVCDGKYCFPRVVWSFWHKEKTPKDVEEMVNVTKKALVNFTYCFLNDNNVSTVLNLDNFPPALLKSSAINRGDYVRVYLLKKYGGVWADATTFIHSGNVIEWFISEAFVNKSGMVAFQYPYRDHWIHFSFFGAPEDSQIIKKFFREYETAWRMGHKKYINKTCPLLRTKKIKLSQNICRLYFMIDVIFFNATAWNKKYNDSLHVLPANLGPMGVFIDCKYKVPCMYEKLLDDPQGKKQYPYIKMFSTYRYYLRDKAKEKEKNEKDEEKGKEDKKKEKGKENNKDEELYPDISDCSFQAERE